MESIKISDGRNESLNKIAEFLLNNRPKKIEVYWKKSQIGEIHISRNFEGLHFSFNEELFFLNKKYPFKIIAITDYKTKHVVENLKKIRSEFLKFISLAKKYS